MTAAVIPFPARTRRVYGTEESAIGAANDSDLAVSFDEATRRGDVIGALLRAAQAPRRGNRPAKVRDGEMRTIEAIRVEQATAWIEALIEIADHGATPDILGAMHALVLAMDGKLRDRAQARLDSIENGEPVADVAKLRRELARMRAGSASPPSGPRSTAWLREALRLRRDASDALGAITGDVGEGCCQLGGVQLDREDARVLASMARELSVQSVSSPHIVRMARQAKWLVLGATQRPPGQRDKAEHAAERLEALANFIERGGVE